CMASLPRMDRATLRVGPMSSSRGVAASRMRRIGATTASTRPPADGCPALSSSAPDPSASPPMAYENLLTEMRDRVAIVTLHRPQRLNALSDALADELKDALAGYDADPGISV